MIWNDSVYVAEVAEDGDNYGAVRQSNAELVDVHGFRVESGRKSLGRVVAISEEISETVRIDMAWVCGNVNWEKRSQRLLHLLRL